MALERRFMLEALLACEDTTLFRLSRVAAKVPCSQPRPAFFQGLDAVPYFDGGDRLALGRSRRSPPKRKVKMKGLNRALSAPLRHMTQKLISSGRNLRYNGTLSRTERDMVACATQTGRPVIVAGRSSGATK